jgi:predicted nucleic acid-binding protein
VIVILDASTLINLVNGEVLAEVLSIPGVTFQMSAVVRTESKSIADAIDAAIAEGRIGLVDDSLISISAFREAKRQMQLGDGETECILAAAWMCCAIGCDDRAARKHAKQRLGADKLMGSIGLLRMAIDAGLLSSEAAFASYGLMGARGGYLPQLAPLDFKASTA